MEKQLRWMAAEVAAAHDNQPNVDSHWSMAAEVAAAHDNQPNKIHIGMAAEVAAGSRQSTERVPNVVRKVMHVVRNVVVMFSSKEVCARPVTPG